MCIDLWKLWIGPILLCGRLHEIGTLCRNGARSVVRVGTGALASAGMIEALSVKRGIDHDRRCRSRT